MILPPMMKEIETRTAGCAVPGGRSRMHDPSVSQILPRLGCWWGTGRPADSPYNRHLLRQYMLVLRGRFEIGCQACSSSSSALASFK
jgi:hypothetical protein